MIKIEKVKEGEFTSRDRVYINLDPHGKLLYARNFNSKTPLCWPAACAPTPEGIHALLERVAPAAERLCEKDLNAPRDPFLQEIADIIFSEYPY